MKLVRDDLTLPAMCWIHIGLLEASALDGNTTDTYGKVGKNCSDVQEEIIEGFYEQCLFCVTE